MLIYAIGDIHGQLFEFERALKKVCLDAKDTKLVLLGDYVHRGHYNKQVLDKVISLQEDYGEDKIIALMGNHEDFILHGEASIDTLFSYYSDVHELFVSIDKKYVDWMKRLPKYYVESDLIFVHAGINEEAGDLWESGTPEDWFMHKYPAETGKINGLDSKVVAGHVGIYEFNRKKGKQNVVYDGENHIYIDGQVYMSGVMPVFMTDTDTGKLYEVLENETIELKPNLKE